MGIAIRYRVKGSDLIGAIHWPQVAPFEHVKVVVGMPAEIRIGSFVLANFACEFKSSSHLERDNPAPPQLVNLRTHFVEDRLCFWVLSQSYQECTRAASLYSGLKQSSLLNQKSSVHELCVSGILGHVAQVNVRFEKASKQNKAAGTILPLEHGVDTFDFLKHSTE